MQIRLLRRDGRIVVVELGDHPYAGTMQGAGKVVGGTAAVLKMLTLDLLDKVAGNTELGLGTKLGYQATYMKRDQMWEERLMKKNFSMDSMREFANKAKIDIGNLNDDQIVTSVTRVKILAEDKEGKHRYPAFHQAEQIEAPRKSSSETKTNEKTTETKTFRVSQPVVGF